MKSILKSVLALLVSGLLTSQSSASVVISIFAGRLDDASGSAAISNDALIQLVNLGPDGVFNPIDLADGSIGGTAQWVSGDDTVLDLAFLTNNGQAGDFPSAAAFDLAIPSEITGPGELSRTFEFATGSIALGTKLGIRWFPGLTASAFSQTTLEIGQAYGQFTRQSDPVNNGTTWVVTVIGGLGNEFDPLATTEIGGTDPATAGNASPLTVVPEPAAIGMSLIGAAGLALLRRRRA